MRTRSQHYRTVRGIRLDIIVHQRMRLYIGRVGEMNLRFFKDDGVWVGQARKNFNGRFDNVRVNKTLDKVVRDTLKYIQEDQ